MPVTAYADNYAAQPNVSFSASPVIDNDLGSPLSVSAVNGNNQVIGQPFTLPSGAVVSMYADGHFDFWPVFNSTTDSFSYTVTDGAASDSAGVTINFNASPPPSNQPPVAMNDEYSTPHDQVLTVDAWYGVLINDTDANGDTLSAQLYASAAHGSAVLNSDGSFSYTPNVGFAGDDAFSYRASDGLALSAITTVTIHVTNDAPVAEADELYLHAGLVLSVDATSGLKHNDYDVNSDPLTVQQVGVGFLHGTGTFDADGSLTYQANQGYVGDDTASYRLFDGATYSSTVAITIHVQNDTPEGGADSFDVWRAAGISGPQANVLANDSDADVDAMTAFLEMPPVYAASFQLNADGSFLYLPAPGAPATDSFSYKAFDGTTYSTPIIVTLSLTDTAVAKDASYVVDLSGQMTVLAADGLLAKAFNPANVSLTASMVQPPPTDIGTVNLNSDGGFSFMAGQNFTGEADFSFAIAQGGVTIGQAIARVRNMIFLSTMVGLTSVTFDGNATITDAPTLRIYSGAQWLDPLANGDTTQQGFHQYPISFTSNTRIGVQPSFKLAPWAVAFWRRAGNNVLVRAVAPDLAPAIQLRLGYTQAIHLQLNSQNQLTTTGFVRFDGALPAGTQYYEQLRIAWQISPDNGTTWITPGVANTSSNQTYVTLADPTGFPGAAAGPGVVQKLQVDRTVFYAGIWGSIGATTEAQLVQYVWAGFQNRTITRADGTLLTYWSNWVMTGGFTTPSLIMNGDGRCGAWSRFFVDVLRAQGGKFSQSGNYRGIELVNPTGNRPTFLMVNNWTFGAANIAPTSNAGIAEYTNVNRAVAVNQFIDSVSGVWRYVSADDPNANVRHPRTGLPGQNNPTPRATFGDHAVVLIGNTLYDPSYGMTYALGPADNPLVNFEANAIAGYGTFWREQIFGVFQNFFVFKRPPATPTSERLTLMSY